MYNSKNCKFTAYCWILMQWDIFQASCILSEHCFNKLTMPEKIIRKKNLVILGIVILDSLKAWHLKCNNRKSLNFNVTNSEMTQRKEFLFLLNWEVRVHQYQLCSWTKSANLIDIVQFPQIILYSISSVISPIIYIHSAVCSFSCCFCNPQLLTLVVTFSVYLFS